MVKVSIIVPVYNAEKFLEKCIDTVFTQTLKDIEVICINDGSTDNSLCILNVYKKNHSNMVVITQENEGSGSARNVGIRISKGEYLMFLDPDDYLAGDDVVETLYNSACVMGVKVCGGSVIKNRYGKLSEEFSGRQRKSRVEASIMTCFSQYQYPYAHQRYLIKRSLLIENEIFYPLYRRGQDLPFMTSVLQAAGPFYLIDKDIYVYRKRHKEEIMTEKKTNDMISALYDVMNTAVSNKLEQLFVSMKYDLNNAAKEYWYKLMQKNDDWDQTIRVNSLIREGNKKFGYDVDENCLMNRKIYLGYINELKNEWEEVKKIFGQYEKTAIYGAGLKGRQIYRYLMSRNYCPDCFVVTNIRENEYTIDEIPVIPVDAVDDFQKYCFVIGVLDQTAQENIKINLEKKGCNNNIIIFNTDICTLLED